MEGRCCSLCLVFSAKGIFFFILALLGAVVCQYSNPRLVGTNYQTKDQSRREIVDDKGNIQGQYSYVDPSGSTINVKYLAGNDGFKILNEPNNQQQLVSQPHARLNQIPISYQSQKSGKPLQPSFQRQPQLFKQQQQIYQEPLQEHVYQQAYQTPLSQPSFQSYEASQAFQQNQDYQQQYQPTSVQASPILQNLFTPAEQPYPAYTAGQVESMREFFEDEKAEMEKMEREASSTTTPSRQRGQAYVSVKNTKEGYSYDINL
ncbi:hypothetical protein CBL_07063 [Carabus blaptoides fortunei]